MATQTQEGFPSQDEIDGYWDWDKIHAPRPLTPLAGDAVVMAMGEGFTIAQHAFGTPLSLKCRMINNYFYSSFRPDYTGITETPEALQDRYEKMLSTDAMHIGERWVNEWEPSLIPMLEKARTTDYTSLSDDALLTALDEQLQNLVFFWTIHGWINLVLVPSNALTEFYNAELKPEDSTEAYELMQGYRTKSLEAAAGLWRLSRIVKSQRSPLADLPERRPQSYRSCPWLLERGRCLPHRAARVPRQVRLAQRRHLRDRRGHLAREPGDSPQHDPGLPHALR